MLEEEEAVVFLPQDIFFVIWAKFGQDIFAHTLGTMLRLGIFDKAQKQVCHTLLCLLLWICSCQQTHQQVQCLNKEHYNNAYSIHQWWCL